MVGSPVIEFPSAWASNAGEYLDKGLEVHDNYRRDPLVSFSFAPHAPYTVSDASFERIRVMAEQLDHLLTLSAQDNVSIRVMPLAVAVHDGLDGEFTLLDFDAARSIGYVEFQDGSVYVQDPDRIGGYRTAAARLHAAALPQDAFLEVIRARRAALRHQGH